jgi:hypothetical protein
MSSKFNWRRVKDENRLYRERNKSPSRKSFGKPPPTVVEKVSLLKVLQKKYGGKIWSKNRHARLYVDDGYWKIGADRKAVFVK